MKTMDKLFEITPGFGVNNFKFGSKKFDIDEDDILEIPDYVEDKNSIIMLRGINLYLTRNKLHEIVVFDGKAELEGKNLFEIKGLDLKTFLGSVDPETKYDYNEGEATVIVCPTIGVNISTDCEGYPVAICVHD